MTEDQPLDRTKTPLQLLGEQLQRVAEKDERSTLRTRLRARVVVPILLVAGVGVGGVAIARGGSGDVEVPVLIPGAGNGTTVIEVPVECDAEREWWNDRIELNDGTVAPTVRKLPRSEEAVAIGLPTPPDDLCGSSPDDR